MTPSPSVISQALANLDAWLQTMRQPGGYGGPVAHWWRDQLRYTGPGLDWRYEGILIGYSTLWDKTGQEVWKNRVVTAATDLLQGQHPDGSYAMSRFEQNPGRLGTPHEAAASLGLLKSRHVHQTDAFIQVARRNLDNLIAKLWDRSSQGFNDKPRVLGRVPNKLATLGEAFCVLYQVTDQQKYLDFGQRAFKDVARFQVLSGRNHGAIHQFSPDNRHGDGRFFPYYNARCVPPLVQAANVIDSSYHHVAQQIMKFLNACVNADGSWPQIVYQGGARAEYPRWYAGSADILRAYQVMGEALPANSLARLLASQLPSGGFPTGEGFLRKTRSKAPLDPPDYRDVLPVVGWNDKVLRFLGEILPLADKMESSEVHGAYTLPVVCSNTTTLFTENGHRILFGPFRFSKNRPWSLGV